jgi:hypothetical protein
VVLQVGVQPGAAILGAQQPASVVTHLRHHEAGTRARGIEEVLAPEHGAGLGQR